MKKLLSLCVLALIIVSCSKENDPDVQTKSEKKIRVEVEFSGNYQNYQLLFTINSLTKGEGAFVEPLISTPVNTQWTQIIAQGNAYNYIADLTSNKFVVESKEAVNRLGFLVSATQTKNTDDATQTPITALIKVYADNKQIETYTYKALPVGQVTEPISKNLDISVY
jgi:PBP1b-binding outer membrane lipoprotein LpoB